MTDYISRRETEDAFPGLFSTIYTALEINKIIRSIPAADVRPVRWIPVTERLPEEEICCENLLYPDGYRRELYMRERKEKRK